MFLCNQLFVSSWDRAGKTAETVPYNGEGSTGLQHPVTGKNSQTAVSTTVNAIKRFQEFFVLFIKSIILTDNDKPDHI